MKKVILFLVCGLLLAATSGYAQTDFTIHDVLKLCEANQVSDFSSLIKKNGFWEVKAVNLTNQNGCELKISCETGLIESCANVTPKDIVIGANTYGYSGKIFPRSDGFYDTGKIVNGFKIYGNDDRLFKMRRAIFIQNGKKFIAYEIYKGPGVIK